MEHVRFHYQSLQEVREEMARVGVSFPLSENLEVLSRPLEVEGHSIPNRLAIQPMEGADAYDNVPSEWMKKRYHRFGQSGAGLVWWEATAVFEEAKATPGQICIKPETVDTLKAMVEDVKETALKEQGIEPVIIMQATHSGRYSKPHGYPEPIIAYSNPLFEKDKPIDPSRIITDDRLKEIEEQYYYAAKMAKEAGFDGIDVKACHRYLNCELLSAYTREGEYGGSFENRTRFFRNAFANAKNAVSGSDFIVTSRMNLYDGFPYPYGWGVAEGQGIVPDMTEPKKLVGMLMELGMKLVNITIGNPYVNPHVNRPYDNGGYIPPEHPFEGVARMYQCTKEIAEAYPDLKIIASGPSYLRQYSENLAAGAVEQGIASMVGFGRMSFAYQGFAADMLKNGGLDRKKVCIACGKCAELLRACQPAGCVVRNPEYTKIYQEFTAKSK